MGDWERGELITRRLDRLPVEHAVKMPQGMHAVVDRLRGGTLPVPAPDDFADLRGRDALARPVTERLDPAVEHGLPLHPGGEVIDLLQIAGNVGCQCAALRRRHFAAEFHARALLPTFDGQQVRAEREALLAAALLSARTRGDATREPIRVSRDAGSEADAGAVARHVAIYSRTACDTSQERTSMEVPMSDPQHEYPAVPSAYDFVIPSYQWLVGRFDAADQRLTFLLGLISTLTLGAKMFATALRPDISFRSVWFISAIVLCLCAGTVGIRGRVNGRLRLSDPMVIYQKNLHHSEWAFKKNTIFFAGQHFNANAEAIRRKGNTSAFVA